MLAAGADPSKANVYGETPLFTAALDGHCHVCECVLAAAAARNLPSSSMTTVDEESTDSSSSSSSFVEVADAEGTSPLLAAVQGGHLEVIERGVCGVFCNANSIFERISACRCFTSALCVVELLPLSLYMCTCYHILPCLLLGCSPPVGARCHSQHHQRSTCSATPGCHPGWRRKTGPLTQCMIRVCSSFFFHLVYVALRFL